MCLVRCRKSIQKGSPGFGYGFVCAFCFTLGFFCLLCGLVLDGFKDTVKDQLEVKREQRGPELLEGLAAPAATAVLHCAV